MVTTTDLRDRIVVALLNKFTAIPASDIDAAAEIARQCKVRFEHLDEHGLIKAVIAWLKHREEAGLSLTSKQKCLRAALDPLASPPTFAEECEASCSSCDSSFDSGDDIDDDDNDTGLDADDLKAFDALHTKETDTLVLNSEPGNYGKWNESAEEEEEEEDCMYDEDYDEDEDEDEDEEEEANQNDQETAAWLEFWSNVRSKPRVALDVNEAGSYVVKIPDVAESLTARLHGRTVQIAGVAIPPTARARKEILEAAHRMHATLPIRQRRVATANDCLRHLGKNRFGNVEEQIALPEDADVSKATAAHANGNLTISVPRYRTQPRRKRAPAMAPRQHHRSAAHQPQQYQDPYRRSPFHGGPRMMDRSMLGRSIFADHHDPFRRAAHSTFW